MTTTSNMCIACQTTEELLSIFDSHECDDGEIEPAAALLKNCFDIEIAPESDLKVICGTCMLKLRGAYYFKLEITKNTREIKKQAYLQLEYLEESLSDLDPLDKIDDVQNYDDSELDPETGYIRNVINKNADDVVEDVVDVQNFDQKLVLCKENIAKSFEDVRKKKKIEIAELNSSLIEKKDSNMQKVVMLHDSADTENTHYSKVQYGKSVSFHNFDNIKKSNNLNSAPKPNILKHKNETSSHDTNENNKESKQKRCNANKSVTFTDEKSKAASKQKYFNLTPGQTQCSVCPESFHSTKKLHEHMNVHYPNYTCEQCKKKFASKQTLKRHMETHLKGPFPCNICDQMFTKLNTRSAHIWRVHQTTNPYLCSACGDRFKTFHQRLKHQQQVHGQTDPKYPCPYCKNKYFYAGSRSQHIRTTHLRERQYKCSQCPMSFPKRRGVLSHMATVHGIGEKQHRCHVCEKSFYRSTTLKYHLKTHERTEITEHKCTVCNARFSYKAVLRCHMKCHELEGVSTSSADTQEAVVAEDRIIEGSNNTVYLDFLDI